MTSTKARPTTTRPVSGLAAPARPPAVRRAPPARTAAGPRRARRRRVARWIGPLGLLLALLVAGPMIAYGFPALVGQDAAYLVLSGSMVPAFAPGDIVWGEKVATKDLVVGDVITFRSAPGSERLYTHRIIAVDDGGFERTFRTQGDANEDPDPNPVAADLVLARYSFHVPFYGKLLALITTKAGLLIVAFIPGLLIIAHQLRTIVREIVAAERRKQEVKGGTVGRAPTGPAPLPREPRPATAPTTARRLHG